MQAVNFTFEKMTRQFNNKNISINTFNIVMATEFVWESLPLACLRKKEKTFI